LQPADTHCFLKYKAYLRQRYQELACDAVDGRVSLTDVLLAMNSGCRKVFQAHAWSKSFDDNGFTPGQRLVRRSILNHLEWEEVPPAPPILPTLRQFAAICHNAKIFPWTTYSVHSKTPGCHRPPIHTLRPLPRRFQKTWNHGTFDCDPDLVECVLPQTPTVAWPVSIFVTGMAAACSPRRSVDYSATSSAAGSTGSTAAVIAKQLREQSGGNSKINSLSKSIAEVRASQKALKKTKTRLATQSRSARKRKRRLKVRASLLSNDDLVHMLLLREKADKADSLPGNEESGASDAAETAPAAAGVGRPKETAAAMSAQ